MAAFKVCLLCSLLWIVAAEERKEVTITCRPSEECVLPCQFESDGKGARIMWYRKKAVVSCTRYGNTSFAIDHKSPADKYKGRTGLFADQVLEGNATLLLRNVTPYDQGKYYCITMTAPRIDKSSIISLVVEAPVREVDIWFSGDSVICAAEGIYPAPTVAWSTDPPTDAKLNKTEIQENKLGFYDIQSDLRLKGNLTSDLTYICCVTCGTNRKTAFLKHEASVAAPVGGVVQISCSLPRSIQQSFNLTWRFRLSGPVASISVVGQKLQVKVWDPWKSHVLSNFSASNGLHLHNLKSEHQGNYTCEIRTPEETHVTWTDVTVTEESYHYFYISIIAGLLYFLFLSYVASAILAYIIIKLKRARNRPDDRDEASESLNGQ
ncbi:V-set domain-containing T-cell activation inhibitor 1-like [Paralichthys olivaceus]|uniref:V-set domain-containing T-cell activation inhibitor 1-like n=1 Tax=Paralichthys olivaceus TaxID=8255 RepID=UPI00097D65F8|nr:PREDICTED: V-set domain-containing T-cell activation inhibitor 1-like [Paralichthys olivaceus]